MESSLLFTKLPTNSYVLYFDGTDDTKHDIKRTDEHVLISHIKSNDEVKLVYSIPIIDHGFITNIDVIQLLEINFSDEKKKLVKITSTDFDIRVKSDTVVSMQKSDHSITYTSEYKDNVLKMTDGKSEIFAILHNDKSVSCNYFFKVMTKNVHVIISGKFYYKVLDGILHLTHMDLTPESVIMSKKN